MTHAKLDAHIADLRGGATRWAALPLSDKIALLEQVRKALSATAERLATLSAERKGVPVDSTMAGDEWVLGPWSAAYGITTLIDTLALIARGARPPLRVHALPNGQAAVRVFPADAFENLLVNGLTADVWLEPTVAPVDARAQIGAAYVAHPAPAVALVLGAGNITSIPILDTLHKLFVEGQAVLLKMNPVNDYAGPLIAEIFAPLIAAGCLRMAYGGAEVGAYLTAHSGIDEIHITGSERTHDAIVFGTGADGARRKTANEPVMRKRITSELGGVCPVIVVPGRWTAADLRFQAENIVSQRIYHNGYNCCSSQVLVLPRDWAQSGALLDAVRAVMREQPARSPYYPGTLERAQAQRDAHPGARVETFEPDPARTLISALDPAEPHAAFRDEAFCPVLAVTELDAPDVDAYLDAAVAFANAQLTGTLSATILIDPRTEHAHAAALTRAITALRYGSVGVNIWAAGGFMLPGAAWGAFPGHTIDAVGSGIGFVHNAYLIARAEKTVLRGAFRAFPRAWRHADFNLMPKPLWFVTNRNALEIARRVTSFSLRPGWRHMPGLFAAALRG
jgi:aldehyde dehydrogenase (NAD(P)+)